MPLVAGRLRHTAAMTTRELTVDAAPLDEMHAELLELEVPKGSHLHGVTIDELRLPTGATVTLVVREDRSFMPEHWLRIRAGDQILIVVTDGMREAVEARLLAIHESGRLAGWVTPGDSLTASHWLVRLRRIIK